MYVVGSFNNELSLFDNTSQTSILQYNVLEMKQTISV